MIYHFIKRLMDIAISAVALLVLLPFFVIIAAIIAAESTGSPLFVQNRVGRGGRLFPIVKFRSMVKDAPKLGAWHTAQDDPRITRFGKFLRITSIDELPQLWNVLTGDMSLIGPRPNTPQQESQYSASQWEMRHRVRPGITGLAQVNGRSAISLEEQTRYDLAYAEHPTFFTDMGILLKTIKMVLLRSGVN